jgi:4-aminobutyrate aminotransferase-like enzyme/Ser/Thr protein kinase RdoA (MazF antagonist)
MDHSLFETPRPNVSVGEAEALADQLFGIVGTATPLDGERDRNFCISADGSRFALRIGHAADRPDSVAMLSLAMEQALATDPSLPIPSVIRTRHGEPIGHARTDQGEHPVQLVTFLPGITPPDRPTTPAFRRSVGTTVARLSRALRGFDHPALTRHLVWDLARLPELASRLVHVDPARRPLLERRLAVFEQALAPALRSLPHQFVYGDAHAGNLLVDPADPDRITGLVDFGDATRGPRVLDVAITAAYQVFGADPLDALVQTVAAYHATDPLDEIELALIPGLAASRLAQSYLISAWRSALHPDNRDYIMSDSADAWDGLVAIDALDPDVTLNEVRRACGMGRPRRRPLDEAVAHRGDRLGPALSLSYADPVRLESGDGVWLIDTDGSRLLDAYNNVPHVGHGHPQVTSAIAAQVRRLTTNTRYLVDEVGEYADRLVGLLPDELSVVMFVNSGSEANDVAYQIARVVTGRRGVVVTDHAYHGTTFVTSMMSPEELGHDRLEGWIAHVGGAGTLSAPDAASRVEVELVTAFADLAGRGEAPAMVIFDDVFSSDGIFAVPAGYLRTAYAAARAAGALCVADEVQAGFGRVGSSFWGFAQDGVIPDIVTLGKPMGNGHPMGAVVTTPSIAAEFAAGWHFFSTFAGSPVAAAAGSAVLDVLDRERLPERADEVGAGLRQAIAAMAHPAIVAVRGPGLFIGVEMTDAATAQAAVEGLRRQGVLVGRTGPDGNVVKVRPPMVFSRHHGDLLVSRLATVLDIVG